jgi:hypothetical protein
MPDIGTDARVLATDGTILSATTTGDSYLGPFYNYGFRAIRFMLEKTAESGTTPALAWVFEFQSRHDLAWNNLLDHAGNQMSGVTFAAAATGLRYVDIVAATALPGPDTDGVLVYGTNYKIYEGIIPYAVRAKLTLSGTGAVTATIGATVEGYV